MKKQINAVLARFDLKLTRMSTYNRLVSQNRQNVKRLHDLEFLRNLDLEAQTKCFELLPMSNSQLRQDLFVLSELDFKTGGYFVEFGATDGVSFSNSNLLESEFGWNGILAEPARKWHRHLRANRNAHIETDCVWSRSGETLTFNETEIAVLSTIDRFSDSDHHAKERTKGTRYTVNTISLDHLLEKHNAPRVIDYLSIDTEGSEYEILESFDFKKYRFRVITCEHNNTPNRQKIFELLSGHGYERKLTGVSQFDDWYVHSGTRPA